MVESPASPTSAVLIKTRIDEKRLFEARFLLKKVSSEIDPSTSRQLRQQLENLIVQAEQVFARAEQLEEQGRYEEARQGYAGIFDIVVDFPAIDRALQRVTVALALGPLQSVSPAGEEEKVASSLITPQPEPEARPTFLQRRKLPLFFGIIGVVVLTVFAVLGIFRAKNELPAQAEKPVPKGVAITTESANKSVALPVMPKAALKKETQPESAEGSIVLSRAIEPPIVQDESKPVREKKAAGKKNQSGSVSAKNRSEVLQKTEQTEQGIKAETAAADVAANTVVKVVIPAQRQAPQKVHVRSFPAPVVRSDTYEFGLEEKVEEEKSKVSSADNVFVRPSAKKQRMHKVPQGDEFVSADSEPQINSDGTYTVQSGDSLGGIAHKVFGNSLKWSQLYNLNRDQLASPSSLRVGQKLRIRGEGGRGVDSDPVGE